MQKHKSKNIAAVRSGPLGGYIEKRKLLREYANEANFRRETERQIEKKSSNGETDEETTYETC